MRFLTGTVAEGQRRADKGGMVRGGGWKPDSVPVTWLGNI